VSFSAVIKNVGLTASPAGQLHAVAFYVDGRKFAWSTALWTGLEPGASANVVADGGVNGTRWTAEAGPHAVMAVVDERLLSAAALRVSPLSQWVKPEDKNPADWVGRMVESACARLLKAGLIVSGRVEKGDPKKVLVDKAARWRADSVFLGARGLTRWERFLPGSVSTAVASRAPCGVELIRGPRRETPLTSVYG
jgi:nucleotide-binding universal stress UspA family protein